MSATTSTSLIFLSGALLCIAIANACRTDCRFYLCEKTTISLTSTPDFPLTSAVCKSGQEIGIFNTAEAIIEDGSTRRNISDIEIDDLSTPYSPTFFKAYPNNDTDSIIAGSGIGHEIPQGNQALFLAGRCIALPITRYQILSDKRDRVIDNVDVIDSPLQNCVAFEVAPRTTTPKLSLDEPLFSIEPSEEPEFTTEGLIAMLE